jgi:endonuclease/exonuclease/phosphatase family metal-dependent hydrolase
MRQIAATMDPLNPPTSMKDLCRRHRWLNKDLKQPWSLRRVAARHPEPQCKCIRFLSYNTYLMPYGGNLFLNPKPAYDARRKEIGWALAGSPDPYDLVALTEVWTDEAVRDIANAFNVTAEKPGKQGHAVFGPLGDTWHKGDSCLIISPDYRIEESNCWIFNERGHDIDGAANKGILWARIRIGSLGAIDLYVTHLYSGDQGHLSDTHVAQLKELVEFVADTHKLGNVAVITGDFNIDSRDRESVSYKTIHKLMGDIGMQDVWDLHWADAFGGEAPNLRGPTTAGDHGDNAEMISRLLSGMEWASAQGKPPSKDPRFCPEPTPDGFTTGGVYYPFGGRIDYLFVERYIPQHTFYLDISRIRRRLFKRAIPASAREGMDYLSDHLGLDVTFIVSPRPPESIFSDPCSLIADRCAAIRARIGALQRQLLDPRYANSEVIPERIFEAEDELEEAAAALARCRAEHPLDPSPY